MPKRIQARAAQDEQEESQAHKLARSHHAPADWKFHAQMVIESWAGKTPNEITVELKSHPKTVCIHLTRFNAEGISGLRMREGADVGANISMSTPAHPTKNAFAEDRGVGRSVSAQVSIL